MKNPIHERLQNSDYAKQKRAARDPKLDAIIQAQGRNGKNPMGVYAEQKLYSSTARHNPYLNIVIAVLLLALGIFIATKVSDFWPWVILGITIALVLVIVIQNAVRAPSWHRARKAAKEYVKKHGGEVPEELDILS